MAASSAATAVRSPARPCRARPTSLSAVRRCGSSTAATGACCGSTRNGNGDGRGRRSRLDAPAGLAVDAAGTVFVADTQNHRVLRYAAAAAPQVFGGYGTALGRFKLPRGLALGAAGELFVADSGNQRVQVLSATTGAATAAIGSAAQFAAIRGLALDDAGRLYVADATANAVHVFGPAAARPVLRLDSPSREFGSVPVGVSLDRVVAVHNDGSSALTVSAVSSSSAVFAALTPTPLQLAPGATGAIRARFAPSAAGFVSATLTIASDSVTGPSTAVLTRGTGIVAPAVDAFLVLDRSGSMLQSAGSQTKMAALQQAAQLFIDLARAGAGDRIGVVDFDDIATTTFALTPSRMCRRAVATLRRPPW